MNPPSETYVPTAGPNLHQEGRAPTKCNSRATLGKLQRGCNFITDSHLEKWLQTANSPVTACVEF